MNKSFAGMTTEFAPGVIRGIRAWQLTMTGLLTGLTYPARWDPGLNVAQCGRSVFLNPLFGFAAGLAAEVFPPHTAPMPECSCGFYAYFGDTMPYQLPVVGRGVEFTFGIIEAFGRVLIGELGFRAEKARIAALYSPTGARFSRYHNIPVFDDVDKMVAEFPPDLSNSVSPPAPEPAPLAFEIDPETGKVLPKLKEES